MLLFVLRRLILANTTRASHSDSTLQAHVACSHHTEQEGEGAIGWSFGWQRQVLGEGWAGELLYVGLPLWPSGNVLIEPSVSEEEPCVSPQACYRG